MNGCTAVRLYHWQERETMITKEQVKQEIDQLPDDVMEQIYVFICSIKPKKSFKKPIRSFKLKGQFDKMDIRELAYE